MKFQFNFFGTLILVLFFVLFSSLGMMTEPNTDMGTNDNENSQTFTTQTAMSNNTGNNTNNSQSQSNNTTCTCQWRPPLENKTSFKAGSTIPIKFNCTNNNTFVVDENVTVIVIDDGNNTVANFTVAKNPSVGIKIQAPTQYHVNWKTPKGMPGNYTIIASFSCGMDLIKAITLF